MYTDNIYFIHCSRQNKCGALTSIIYDNTSDLPAIELQTRDTRSKNSEKINKFCDNVFGLGRECILSESWGFPEEEAGVRYFTETRGISFDTLYKSGVLVSFGLYTLPIISDSLYKHVDSLSRAKFKRGNEYFERYNIIFAVTNDVSGRFDRLVFRSTKHVKLKELQFKLYNDAQKHLTLARDPKESKIAICESIIDGLSLLEMGWGGSVLCAMGANAVVSAVREFDFSKYKEIVIALDNDVAGRKFSNKVQQIFPNARMLASDIYASYKDLNEMLILERFKNERSNRCV